ncbi:NAD(P)H-binding protein [Variovorax sp. Sphag1AA]|uniref:NAD(P)H-binding protein n=1 Tax=Variovorax sp. Sphag1AA TaxID=2587027 RepID=UPI0016206010|nr:NAD(P)H-binding protein [Variovorax sp. Sphag1AA]MBB3179871.1 nucleoside-diphosphate-sugar epimerase [Variovorax sp. Sphag1AA]
MERGTALVLGATGGIGGETASALLRRGWKVRALARDPAKAAAQWPAGTLRPEWVSGDAMDADSVIAAARGADLIVHAVNPPGYRNWETLVLPMLDSTVRAAEASGARIVLPGTVYNYGPDAFPDLVESAPQNPISRKGAIRVQMEQRLRDAAARGVRSLVVRAGDFFGPRAGNNWFAQGLVKPGKPISAIADPARRGVGHQWAYLPDVAETIAQLVERESALTVFDTFHMEGHWDADGTRMQAAIRRASGRPDLPVKRFPWWLVALASPFVPMFRELREMRYLWQKPVHLRNGRLVALLGSEPHTPLDAAVGATLEGLGCLEATRPHGKRQPA